MNPMTKSPTLRLRRSSSSRDRRDGAAMLVVMLVMVMITAGSVFAAHSTSFELRAAGHGRQAMQTQYVAEGGMTATSVLMEQLGARSVEYAMQQTQFAGTQRLAPEEPPLARSLDASHLYGNFRVRSEDFTPGSRPCTPGIDLACNVGRPLETTYAVPSLGPSAYQPSFIVDVNDVYRSNPTFVSGAAGQRVDGGGTIQMRFLSGTLTGRGRTRPATDVFGPTDAAALPQLQRSYHETAVNARAFTITGPYAAN